MCQFISGYVTKKTIRINPFVDSHEDQISINGDEHLDKKGDLVRFEITPPPDFKDFWDVSKWHFKIDQDILPDWASISDTKFQAREKLREILDNCPDCTYGIKVLDGRIVAIKGKGKIGQISENSIILYAGHSTIEYAGFSTIKNAGDSTIENAGFSTIRDAGYSRIKNAGHSRIQYAGYSRIEYAGYSRIRYAGDSTIKYAGYSRIEYAGFSTIEDAGHSTIKNAGD